MVAQGKLDVGYLSVAGGSSTLPLKKTGFRTYELGRSLTREKPQQTT